MITVKRLLTYTALTLSSLSGGIWADEVQLRSGGQLSGEIVKLSDDGGLDFSYDYALEPLVIKTSAVSSFTLTPQQTHQELAFYPTLATLKSGDQLSGELTGLNAEMVTLRNESVGEVKLPRAVMHSLSLNRKEEKMIYSGPRSNDEWVGNENWVYSDGVLISEGNGSAFQDIDLSRNFIVKFRYQWEDSPNFQVFFCDPGPDHGRQRDRYFFHVTRIGMDLKRESPGQRNTWNTLGTVLRRTSQFPEKSIDLEFRVNREERLINVLINGVEEGRFTDRSAGSAPSGGGISFDADGGGRNTNRISQLEVIEWDSVSAGHRAEKRGDATTDSVIDTFGARYSGVAQEVDFGGAKPEVVFSSPHSNSPIRIPLERTSTLFFAEDSSESSAPEPTYLVLLGRYGKLLATGVNLLETKAIVSHPSLGDLEIDRSIITEIAVKGRDQ